MNNHRNFENSPISSIHGTIVPADVRDGDMIKAKVKSMDPNKFYSQELRVWRISPLGVELVVEDDTELDKGLHISLDIQFGHQKSQLTGLVVDSIVIENKVHLAHIRLIPFQEKLSDPSLEKRDGSRWICSDQFFPTAVASNPAKFNDFVYFKIKDISYGGFKLTTSLRNKFIIPGIVFDCIVNFPMISQVNIKLTVKNARVELEGGRETLSVGVTFDAKNENLNQVVGQYLMQFGSAKSLTEIQKAGFFVHKVSESVAYSYVKTKDEFEDVLKLRFEAYKAAGKVADNKTYIDMTDFFDAKSRIVIGKYKGEIVCSARMIFHQVGEAMEQEKYVKWPSELPRSDELVEIMRACTRTDFRGSDLLIGMFKYMAVTVAQAKKSWIVICATKEMEPFYTNIGFKEVGLSYEHASLNNLRHTVMIANFRDGMAGRTVGPIFWNLVWSDSVKYLSQFEMIEIDPFMQMRLTIYKWFAPIARFLFTKKIRSKLQRHLISEKEKDATKALGNTAA